MSRQDREGEHVGRGDREEKRRLPRCVGGREPDHRIRKIVDGPKERNRSEGGEAIVVQSCAGGSGLLTRPVFAMASATSLPVLPVWALTWWNRAGCSSHARRRRSLARWTGAVAWWALERPPIARLSHIRCPNKCRAVDGATAVTEPKRSLRAPPKLQLEDGTRYRRHGYWKQAHHHGTLPYVVTVPNPSGPRQPLPIQRRAAEAGLERVIVPEPSVKIWISVEGLSIVGVSPCT